MMDNQQWELSRLLSSCRLPVLIVGAARHALLDAFYEVHHSVKKRRRSPTARLDHCTTGNLARRRSRYIYSHQTEDEARAYYDCQRASRCSSRSRATSRRRSKTRERTRGDKFHPGQHVAAAARPGSNHAGTVHPIMDDGYPQNQTTLRVSS
ncbi:unnamed protein product, partial [Iphiclides podalirius]